jgi:antitoxin PrlF
MKNESTISVKGQITVPAEIRKRFGCAPGTRLGWHVLDDGRLMVRVMTSTRTVKKS